ncbi:hypothetical protein SAMN04487895_101580 [Paenibacillus sophorae]|uniref:Uncharacterized protein n=1 Tax=Paenibacillus sophorae TaxID=1333845 RepID=A0A1H8GNH4_9BACL|nr:hypothetical protein [Paenibacillus sophorae]QWU14282.1 hypothetical protein KP014_20460 [Paenibacillus sophorae]SEN45365.1 hypothetical protein SAMN04487895_101580 [Paenibacillus sophorae]
MNTIEMIGSMNNRIIAKSKDGRLVTKDSAGNFIYCDTEGRINISLGYEGWVCLTDTFMNQQWELVKVGEVK